jgi:MOSC domain-containing protein YiiM
MSKKDKYKSEVNHYPKLENGCMIKKERKIGTTVRFRRNIVVIIESDQVAQGKRIKIGNIIIIGTKPVKGLAHVV